MRLYSRLLNVDPLQDERRPLIRPSQKLSVPDFAQGKFGFPPELSDAVKLLNRSFRRFVCGVSVALLTVCFFCQPAAAQSESQASAVSDAKSTELPNRVHQQAQEHQGVPIHRETGAQKNGAQNDALTPPEGQSQAASTTTASARETTLLQLQKKRQSIALATTMLAGIVTLLLLLFLWMLWWSRKTRKLLREPLPAAGKGDDLWYLKAKQEVREATQRLSRGESRTPPPTSTREP